MKQYDIAAYVWPAFTGDEPRSRLFWPEGIGEWQTVKNEVRQYPEFSLKRKPLWGYVNEADPAVMEMEIEQAVSHGVNVFIYDWYWYDGRPFLENCLNEGFLKAKNRQDMRFYLMWANHDVNYGWDIRNSTADCFDSVIWTGQVDEKRFDAVCDRVIGQYFTRPEYYCIDGCPVFMIYDIDNLVKGLGSVDIARRKLHEFRERCVKAGLPGLHLQVAQWGNVTHNYSGLDTNAGCNTATLAHALGFDSATNYQFTHFVDVIRNYSEVLPDAQAMWETFYAQYGGRYFPHVSVGWDNNLRYRGFRNEYVRHNEPEEFKKALLAVKDFVDRHRLKTPLITVNSWNEWTECSYLEPDLLYGYGYLEAIREVFVDQSKE